MFAVCAWAGAAPADVVGLQRDVVFTRYSPLSGNAELGRRLLRPLEAAQILQAMSRAGKGLKAQPIDVTQERFLVYAPPHAPAEGDGLLVFVPPWQDGKLPQGRASVLDRYGRRFGGLAAPRSVDLAKQLDFTRERP